jgi:LDH2 family malate/lactate/ureidoglycolate dehydrogenase
MTGAAFGLTPYRDPANHDVGHVLMAIAIERFLPYDDYLARMRQFCAELKASVLAPGAEEILLPGELEHRRAAARLKTGIDLDRETLEMMRDLAQRRDIPFTLEPIANEAKGAPV